MKYKTCYVFIAYIALIFIYATIYYLLSNCFSKPLSFIDSIYFSTVTISTLGYGDIFPVSDLAKIVVVTEAILGIVVIGVFLSSLWQSYVSEFENRQKLRQEEINWIENVQKLVSYNSYLAIQIRHYRNALFEITTPIPMRDGYGAPKSNFKFSDIQDLFNQSLLLTSDFKKPLIQKYFENLDTTANELKYVLANFSLAEAPELHSLIVSILSAFAAHDVKGALLFYAKSNETLKTTIVDMIKEHNECPNLDDYKSNIITLL